jgi:hypothetical protein
MLVNNGCIMKDALTTAMPPDRLEGFINERDDFVSRWLVAAKS